MAKVSQRRRASAAPDEQARQRAGFSLIPAKVPEDIISTIRQAMPALRPSERRVAETLLADVEKTLHSNNIEIANRAGVSEPTVTRFSRAVGCSGLRDLKLKLAQSLVVGRIYLDEPPHVGSEHAKPTLWQSILEEIHRAINTAERQLVLEDFEKAAQAIITCGKLITIGVGGGSTMAASEAQTRFFRLGIAVANYSDGQLMRMVAATLTKQDVILAISTTGKSAEVLDAAAIAKQYGCKIIAITKPNSPLAAIADITLGLYVPEAPDSLKPTASRYAFLAAIDLLAASTAYRSPRTTQDYMRRIKYALVNLGSGETNAPLGD